MQRREIPDAIRGAAGSGRAREAVVATDNVVRVYDYRAGRVIDEVLLIDGATWREPAPVLIDHNRGVPSMVGSVTAFRREPGRLVGTLRFAEGTQQADEAFALVEGGHLRAVSVGYRILESTEIPAGQTQTVAGRLFTAKSGPLRVVTRWEVKEVSLVPIGADAAAGIRCESDLLSMRSTRSPMSTASIPQHEIAHMRLADYGAALIRGRGEQVPENPFEVCRTAFGFADGISDLLDLFTMFILDGWRSGVDSLAGVYRPIDAPNYLQNELAAVTVHPRMMRIGRGDVAPAVSFGIGSQGYRLMRFGVQFVIDEQDAMDGARLGVYRTALEETMRAHRGLVPDLAWSVLLSNPNAADDKALFHADRGNLSTDALDAAAFDTAMGVIAGQTGVDENSAPVHWNLGPRYLIVPPGKVGAAQRLARDMASGGTELAVRSESRLTSTGVLDPRDNETLVTGNGTNWLLAAPGSQKAGIVLALLDGKTEPTVRNFELSAGQWGYGFDVQFSCAVAALDGTPLYWSTGAGP